MFKKLLIFISLLFVSLLITGCAKQDITKVNEMQKAVNANMETFAIIRKNSYEGTNLTPIKANKFFNFAKTLVRNSEKMSNEEAFSYQAEELKDSIMIINNVTMSFDPTTHAISIVITTSDVMMVGLGFYDNRNVEIFYKVKNPEKYVSRFNQLVTDIFK